MSVHYLEIVTPDVLGLCGLYEATQGLSFGPEVPEMGMARVANREDGTLVGIRAPLAEHESPIIRTYTAVDDINAALKAAEAKGAMIAYPATQQGKWGTFAIIIMGGVQLGYWQG